MVTIGPLDGPEGRNPLNYVPGVAPLFKYFGFFIIKIVIPTYALTSGVT